MRAAAQTAIQTIAVFQYLKGSSKKEGDRLLSRVCGDRRRGNGHKLREGSFRLGTRKKNFCSEGAEALWTGHRVLWLMPRPWRLSRRGWIRPWATWSSCSVPVHCRGLGLDGLQRHLATPRFLWFHRRSWACIQRLYREQVICSNKTLCL